MPKMKPYKSAPEEKHKCPIRGVALDITYVPGIHGRQKWDRRTQCPADCHYAQAKKNPCRRRVWGQQTRYECALISTRQGSGGGGR
jgi:hypothetical protein